LAAGYLSSYADSCRGGRDVHDVVQPDELFELMDSNEIVTRLLQRSPELVALTVYVWNHTEVAEVGRHLRAANPAVGIVIGGPEVSYTPVEGLRRFDADWICTGEGELPFLDLLNKTETCPSFRGSLPGLLSRAEPDSSIAIACPMLKSLDEIPSPYTNGPLRFTHDGWADLETTRGCSYRCRFCSYGKTFDSLRHYSLQRTEIDVRYAIEHGATCVYMMDPTFDYPRERCMTVCRLLAELNTAKTVVFHAEARAEIVDEGLADAFLKAGVKSLEIGLQSSNKETLKLMQRGLGASHFVKGCKLLFERGIEAEIGTIVGLPGDTEESIRRTVEFVLEGRLGQLNVYQLQVLPGSEYFKMASELGFEYDPEPPYYVRRTPTLNEKQIVGLVEELEKLALVPNEKYLADVREVAEGVRMTHDCSGGSLETNATEPLVDELFFTDLMPTHLDWIPIRLNDGCSR
jgi:radical SAM superfamily enzyme YgiQ (UPF0313 family)